MNRPAKDGRQEHRWLFGVFLGFSLGIALGVALGSIAAGIGVGVGVGFVFAAGLYQRGNREGGARGDSDSGNGGD